FAKAEEHYRAAIDANPGVIAPLVAAAEFYVGQKNFDAAEPLLKQAVTLSKNDNNYRMQLGGFYQGQGKFEEAKRVYQEIANDSPNFLKARYQLADLAASQGKMDEAENIINAILKERPKEAGALILRARLLLQRPGNSQKAIVDLEQAQKAEAKIP